MVVRESARGDGSPTPALSSSPVSTKKGASQGGPTSAPGADSNAGWLPAPTLAAPVPHTHTPGAPRAR